MSTSDHLAGVDGLNESSASTLCLMNSEFDALVEKLLDAHHVPGMSIAVIHNGKIQYKV